MRTNIRKEAEKKKEKKGGGEKEGKGGRRKKGERKANDFFTRVIQLLSHL